MGHLDPIAYTYEADYHCPDCAETRFGGTRRDGGYFIAEDCEDAEGNPIGIVAPWDEWWDPTYEEVQTLTCGTCGAELDTIQPSETN